MVDFAGDLGDEQVGERMRLQQPADPDLGLVLDRRAVPGIEPRRRFQQRGREAGRLAEMDHVAGVHPAAGHVDVFAGVGSALDDSVVQVRGAVQGRRLVAVAITREEAQEQRDHGSEPPACTSHGRETVPPARTR